VLTGEFQLSIAGQRLSLPHSVERVVACLALMVRPVARTKLAGMLWAEASESRAQSNLRTALWRLHRAHVRLLDVGDDRLRLDPTVSVDVAGLLDVCRRLIDGASDVSAEAIGRLVSSEDLLPDWDDDWVVTDRERFRLVRLEALERAAETLIEARQHRRALQVALAVVSAEPLRESGFRLLVRTQIAQGNLAEAIRSYRQYRTLLSAELGLRPSPAMESLVTGLRTQGSNTVTRDRRRVDRRSTESPGGTNASESIARRRGSGQHPRPHGPDSSR
jgi:DNA-binding SARP family transcriptional activator